MYRIDNASAATQLPTQKPAGPMGYFTQGDPTTGQQATIVEADFLNTVQEEMMNILSRGGVTPVKTNNAQLLTALANLFDTPWVQIGVTQNLLVPPWATQIAFHLVGAGGGGAHSQSDGTNYRSGGGGGSGAYAEAQRAVTPGQLVHAVVGIGGGSETAGQATSMSFSTTWTVTAGGGGGSGYSSSNNSPGANGGAASGGDLNCNGSFGGDGMVAGVFSTTGYGGNGPWGGGPRAANGGGSPANATGPGAGGAGAYDTGASGINHPGGTGANGIIQYRFLP